MFFCNINVNKTKTIKWLFTIIAIMLIILFIYITLKIFQDGQKDSCQPNIDVIEISNTNYTSVLKEVHDNLNKYIGKIIKFSGYIYRVPDFNDSQFVLARDMIISSDLKTLIVGFLCNYSDAKRFETNTWVEITGIIAEGKYHEAVPLVNVFEIKKITKPTEIYVYPPDESFVPTINLL